MMCPEARGDMSEEERKEVRRAWFGQLATSEGMYQEFLKFVDDPPAPLSTAKFGASYLQLLKSNRKPDEHRVPFVPKGIKERVETLEQELLREVEANRSAKRQKLDPEIVERK